MKTDIPILLIEFDEFPHIVHVCVLLRHVFALLLSAIFFLQYVFAALVLFYDLQFVVLALLLDNVFGSRNVLAVVFHTQRWIAMTLRVVDYRCLNENSNQQFLLLHQKQHDLCLSQQSYGHFHLLPMSSQHEWPWDLR